MTDRINKELRNKITDEIYKLGAFVADYFDDMCDSSYYDSGLEETVDNIMNIIESTFKMKKVKYINIKDIDLTGDDNGDR